MTQEMPEVDPRDAVLTALAVTIKASGISFTEKPSDDDLNEDEKLILGYVRLRAKRRLEAQSVEAVVPETEQETQSSDDDKSTEQGEVSDAQAVEDAVGRNVRAHGDEAGEVIEVPEGVSPIDEASAANAEHALFRREHPTTPVSLRLPMQGAVLPEEHQANKKDADPPDEVGEVGEIEEKNMTNGPSGIPQVAHTPSLQPERVSLPNARAHTPYEATITGYSNLRVRNDNESGISIDENGDARAEKMTAGEYKIEAGGIKDGRAVSLLIRLSVIARPQDLWTSIATDQDAPLAKPDESFEKVEGRAFLVGASKRGRSHAKDGTYRDDHFGLSYNEDTGWHVMVVADGAGSARLSREGSRVACKTTLHALDTYLKKNVDPSAPEMIAALQLAETPEEKRAELILRPVVNSLMLAAHASAKKIEERAAQISCRASDLSTTLAIGAAKKIDDNWLLLSFSIGDGGIGIWDGDKDEVTLMCKPDSGEFAGQTRFLSAEELEKAEDRTSRVFAEVRKDFTAFVGMTDGITDPKFETDAALENSERWRAFWDDDLTKEVGFARNNQDLEIQFLGWMDFWSRGNHDDRTLAVMVPEDLPVREGSEA